MHLYLFTAKSVLCAMKLFSFFPFSLTRCSIQFVFGLSLGSGLFVACHEKRQCGWKRLFISVIANGQMRLFTCTARVCEYIFLFVVYSRSGSVCARFVQNNESENANGTLNVLSLDVIIMI